MNKLQILFAAALCGALFGVPVKLSAQTGKSGCVTVTRVEGKVSYSLGNDKWVPLVAGKILSVGALVRTGNDGEADLVLGKDINLPNNGYQNSWTPSTPGAAADPNVVGFVSSRPAAEQNVVRLTPNTTLGVTKLTVIDTGADTLSDTELDLKKGTIFASVKKLNGASQYLIKLPSGIAGVRGTQFSIGANGATSVYHSTGGGVVLSLTLNGGAPHIINVGAGFAFDPANGQVLALPSNILDFLAKLFLGLQTIYSPVCYVSIDSTCIFVSATHGAHFLPLIHLPLPGGGGSGGDGGDE